MPFLITKIRDIFPNNYDQRHWFYKGGIAIIDQILFSGSNFVLNIFLARMLGINEYGAFSLAFTLYLFLSGFHNALILEPISVLGTSNYTDNLKKYFSTQLILHFFITFILGSCLLIGSGLLSLLNIGDRVFMRALLGVGFFLPFLLLVWLTRRMFYIFQQPGNSLFVSFIYSVCIGLGGIFISRSIFKEDLFCWFALLGVAGTISSFRLVPLVLEFFKHYSRIEFIQLIYEQWLYGRWICLATMLYSIGSQTQIFIAASFLGLEVAGVFRVLQIFMLPMTQILTAVSSLSLPTVALEFGLNNYLAMKRKSRQVAIIMILIAFIYELILLFGSSSVEQFLFAGKYARYASLIPLIGLVPLLNSFETMYSLILRSLQKPMFYMVDKIITAITGGLSALLFIYLWKVSGAVFSLILIEIVTLVTYYWLYRKWFFKLINKKADMEIIKDSKQKEL